MPDWITNEETAPATTPQADSTSAEVSQTDWEKKYKELQPEFTKKSQLVAEYESKLNESETKIQQVKLETEKTYAKEIYWDYVDDPSVQEYKTKYPDLGYKQIFGALGIEVPTQHVPYNPNPWRPAWSLSWSNGSSEYTVSQLTSLRETNPSEYKRVMDAYAKGTIAVKNW